MHGEQLYYFDICTSKEGRRGSIIIIEVGNERKWNIDVVIVRIDGYRHPTCVPYGL